LILSDEESSINNMGVNDGVIKTKKKRKNKPKKNRTKTKLKMEEDQFVVVAVN